mgnify:CR=1 FL=1
MPCCIMILITHGTVIAEPLLPGLDDLRAGDVDAGDQKHQAGAHHPRA